LSVLAAMVRHTHVNKARCAAAAADPALLATDLVDFLVKRGLPFRKAHHAVGALVAEAERTGQGLPALARRQYGPAAARVFNIGRALAARQAIGAPSPANVRAALARWRRVLG
jgi:argininosuccinate lyase